MRDRKTDEWQRVSQVVTITEVRLAYTADCYRPWTIHGTWIDPEHFQSKAEALRYIHKTYGGVRVREG